MTWKLNYLSLYKYYQLNSKYLIQFKGIHTLLDTY